MYAPRQRLLSLLDFTRLQEADDRAAVGRWCTRALTPYGPVAAVCVWPCYVALCRQQLAGSGVRIATVTNFPHGDDDVSRALAETQAALADGADEVDLVFPYRTWLAGNRARAVELVATCKATCGPDRLLKVILEAGALPDATALAGISRDAIAAGADFLKTATGKHTVGATLSAATVMLAAIREAGGTVGFKAAGGIRTVTEALAYLQLAGGVMGDNWINPRTFRIGASVLLDELLTVLNDGD